MTEGLRLHKFLAHAGVGSRRKCEQYIAEGLVTVDGEVVTAMGTLVDPGRQEVRYDGQPVRSEPKVSYLFNKPKGVLSTSSDKEKRPRIIDFFASVSLRVYPAGRLDEDSEGLIVVTNDGDLAERITHPRYGLPKTYKVRVRGHVDQSTIAAIKKGVWLAEGRTSPARIHVVKRGREVSHLEITLFEGRNREIRRLFARFGHNVIHLKRTRIGNLVLRRLSKGRYRRLTGKEVEDLRTGAVDQPVRRSKRR